MISTGIQRSLRLTAALGVACFALCSVACNNPADEEDGSTPPAATQNGDATPANGNQNAGADTPDTETDGDAVATVRAFQEAVLDLDFELARTMVDETSGAHATLTSAIATMENLARPEIPDAARDVTIPTLTQAWRNATLSLVLEEGNSAIVSVTRADGQMVDVNLNFFEGNWLIVSPAEILQLR